MRSPPGAGKSFEVNKLLKQFGVPREGHVFSTDDQLDKLEGGYLAGVKKAIEGGYFSNMMFKFHKLNQEAAMSAMKNGITPIIIDNTNITKKEMQPYVEGGVAYGYEVRFIEPSSEHWQKISPLLQNKAFNDNRIRFAALKLAKKNQHEVPYETIYDMLKKWHVNPKIEDF